MNKDRIKEAYEDMTLSQQLVVNELVSMAVIKGLETGVTMCKNRVDVSTTSHVASYHASACVDFKAEYGILI